MSQHSLHSDQQNFQTNDSEVVEPKATSGHAYLVADFESLLFLASLHQQHGASFTDDLAQARRYTRAQADSACEQLSLAGAPCVVLEIAESRSFCMLTADESDVVRAAFLRIDSGSVA